jgi:hypothetical protein
VHHWAQRILVERRRVRVNERMCLRCNSVERLLRAPRGRA